MKQEIHTNTGQVTKDGDIIVCQGGGSCPFASGDEPESKLQADFAERTGIWCPREAREVFEVLMKQHGFVAKELHAAWQADSIVWNRTTRRVEVRAPWFEVAFGYAMVVVMGFYLLVQAAAVLTAARGAAAAVTAILVTGAIYLGGAWLAVRFVLRPYHVAKRVQRALKEASEVIRSQTLARITVG